MSLSYHSSGGLIKDNLSYGNSFQVPTTIENAFVYYELDQVLRSIGFHTGQPDTWPEIQEEAIRNRNQKN